MDATAALERLRDISSQVRNAVVFERGGKVVGSTVADDERAQTIAREAEELLAQAELRRAEDADGAGEFAQLEVALQGGSVFVVRHEERLIAATTTPEPTVGLVFYDLKSCLRELHEQPPKKRAAPKKAAAPKRKPAPRKRGDAKP
jgi:predicted regulator of Ras-like GTPase activity (Roadblock/LC7/MglB family)